MPIPSRTLTALAAAALTVGIAGCGSDTAPPTAAPAGRLVDITMTDNAFQPTQITFTKGETVTMRFHNNGKVRHEAMIGDEAAQMHHRDDMTASTGQGAHGHMGDKTTSSPDSLSVEPGMTSDMTRTFGESGTILIGCHEPGHWEAGMKSTVSIS